MADDLTALAVFVAVVGGWFVLMWPVVKIINLYRRWRVARMGDGLLWPHEEKRALFPVLVAIAVVCVAFLWRIETMPRVHLGACYAMELRWVGGAKTYRQEAVCIKRVPRNG